MPTDVPASSRDDERPSKVLKARSALGVASRSGDTDEIAIARRDLAAAKLDAYIQKIISEAPPLTQEQRDRLAVLLRSAVEAPVAGRADLLPSQSNFRDRTSTNTRSDSSPSPASLRGGGAA